MLMMTMTIVTGFKMPEKIRSPRRTTPRPTVLLQEITNCRIEAGLTQKAASKLAKLSQTHLDKIERGKNSPSVYTLDRLLNAYGYELEIVRLGNPT